MPNDRQIVWFFDRTPIVLICVHCEAIAAHYTVQQCPSCGRGWVEFKADPLDVQDHLDKKEV